MGEVEAESRWERWRKVGGDGGGEGGAVED